MNAVDGSRTLVPSQAEQAYKSLEHALVTLEFAPGTIVSEGRLIESVGLGRTPVREAMQRLAHQELIQVLPRKGLQFRNRCGHRVQSQQVYEPLPVGTALAGEGTQTVDEQVFHLGYELVHIEVRAIPFQQRKFRVVPFTCLAVAKRPGDLENRSTAGGQQALHGIFG